MQESTTEKIADIKHAVKNRIKKSVNWFIKAEDVKIKEIEDE